MRRERVFDWPGGPLQIVRVLESPAGALLLWEPLEVVECLPLAHGLALPAGLPAQIRTSDGEPLAEIEIGVVGGRPACVAIRASAGHELTTVLLRRMPGLGRVVKETAATATVRVTRTEDGAIVGERHVDASEFTGLDAVRQELRAEVAELAAPQGRRSVTDEFLREVADVYREAHAQKVSTQRAIQERFPTSEANARRWVARAREKGFLGPAPDERRGGERRTERRST